MAKALRWAKSAFASKASIELRERESAKLTCSLSPMREEEDTSMDISMSSENEADESTEEDMPDVDKMTEEEQLANTLQMSVQDK